MSNGFIYCYAADWSLDAASTLLDSLNEAGLKLVNPETRSIVALSSEFETAGDPIPTDIPTLTGWISLSERIDQAFQLWLDGTRNVLSRVARTPDYVLQDFSLNGLDRDTGRSVADAVVRIALSHEEGLAGLVVDLSGESGNTDWDGKLAGRGGARHGCSRVGDRARSGAARADSSDGQFRESTADPARPVCVRLEWPARRSGRGRSAVTWSDPEHPPL